MVDNAGFFKDIPSLKDDFKTTRGDKFWDTKIIVTQYEAIKPSSDDGMETYRFWNSYYLIRTERVNSKLVARFIYGRVSSSPVVSTVKPHNIGEVFIQIYSGLSKTVYSQPITSANSITDCNAGTTVGAHHLPLVLKNEYHLSDSLSSIHDITWNIKPFDFYRRDDVAIITSPNFAINPFSEAEMKCHHQELSEILLYIFPTAADVVRRNAQLNDRHSILLYLNS
jgi:hypothetical protein